MYSNILIPVSFDPSRDLDGALDAARALANEGAQLTLLHVIEPVPVYAEAHVPIVVLHNSRDEMQARLDELAASISGAEAEVLEGHPGRTILHWAQENEADCIVIPSHEPAMSDFLLGSTAHQVVRHARCAVHVLR